MKKTRILDPDVGDRLYWSSSSLTYITTDFYKYSLKPNPAYHYAYGKSQASTVKSGISTWNGFESIESTTNARPKFNNCFHYTAKAVNYPFLQYIIDYRDPKKRYINRYTRISNPGGVDDNSVSAVPWGLADGAARRAWNEMQPRFEGDVAMLNFLFELRDFRNITRHLMNLKFAELGSRLRAFRSRCKTRYGGSTLSNVKNSLADFSSSAANARLMSEFAIKPLISDISNILRQAKSIIDDLQNRLKQIGNEGSISHYTEILNENISGSYGPTNARWSFSGLAQQAVFTATLELKFDYKLRNSWRAMQRYWGFELTPEVIWNAIPFSFVVDYFSKVGNAIHSMSRDPNVTNLRTLQYCESILCKSYKGYFADVARLDEFVSECNRINDLAFVAGNQAEIFHRKVTIPNKGVALPRPAVPTKEQLYNGLALLRTFL